MPAPHTDDDLFGVFYERLTSATGPKLYAWASEVGLPKGVVQSIEQRHSIPKAEGLLQISRATGRSVDWLLGQADASGHDRKGSKGKQSRASQKRAATPSPINQDTLAQILVAIEEFLQERGATVDPTAKARYVAFLYQYFAEREGQRVDAYVHDFLSAAAA
ncbi:hypothetical protein [Pandoraea fibrosis]|nr:hypothetical protein [Pandoraea fibrosis]